MTSSLVVGVDGSEEAPAAVAIADWLALKLNRRLVMAHVARHDAEDDAAEELLNRVGPRDAHRVVLHGDPADELERVARALDASLLAVGSRGRGVIAGALLGSVSRALTRRGPCPILVVPPAAAERLSRMPSGEPGSTIVCGIDHSEQPNRCSDVAAGLARATGLALVLVHSVTPPATAAAVPGPGVGPPIDHHELLAQELRAGTRRLLECAGRVAGDWDVHPAIRLETGQPGQAVDGVAVEQDAALTVIGSHGGGVGAELLGSVASALRADGSRPVLLVPPLAGENGASG